MRNPPMRLNQHERNALLEYIANQQSQGTKSAEIRRSTLQDRDGNLYDMGGDFGGVVVGEQGVPQVMNELRGKFLDCGHAITNMREVLGRYDFGHIICKRDNLYLCSNCRRKTCDLEVELQEGLPLCPKCQSSNMLGIILAIIAVGIGIIYYAERM